MESGKYYPQPSTSIDEFGISLYLAYIQNFYTEIDEMLREYVSNSIDHDAENIYINFDTTNHTITISDDGVGMSNIELSEICGTFAVPTDKPDRIGKFGIGLHAGVRVTNQIVIKTKILNEEAWNLATFPTEEWKNQAKLKTDAKTLEDLKDIDRGRVSCGSEEYGDHGTTLTLHLVPDSEIITESLGGDNQLQSLHEKLSHILPLDFPDTERGRLLKNILENAYENAGVDGYKSVNVFLNDDQLYRPSYDESDAIALVIYPDQSKFRYTDVIGFIAYNYKKRQDGKYTINDTMGRGFRIRKKGVSIIKPKSFENNLGINISSFEHGGASRFAGDFNILSDSINVNESRTKFLESPEWLGLKSYLDNLFKYAAHARHNKSPLLVIPKVEGRDETLEDIIATVERKYPNDEEVALVTTPKPIKKRQFTKTDKERSPNLVETLKFAADNKTANEKIVKKEYSENPIELIAEVLKRKFISNDQIDQLTDSFELQNQHITAFNERIHDLSPRFLKDVRLYNTEAYQIMYIVENYLREVVNIISNIFDGEIFDADRQEGYIICSPRIMNSIKKQKRSDNKRPIIVSRRDNDIDYTTVHYLKLTYEKNWNVIEHFARRSYDDLELIFKTINYYRILIAHNSSFGESEVNTLKLLAKEVFSFFIL